MPLVRNVVKALIRQPWYSASIVVVLTIGFALLGSVLALVDGVLFKSLGYPGEAHLVAIKVSSSQGRAARAVSSDELTAWANTSPETAFTGFYVGPVQSVSGIGIAYVQFNFFDVLGIRPALGGFATEDFDEASSVIEPRIVTDELFQSQFGRDPGAIGRVVILDRSTGAGYRIVGVMPPGFIFPAYKWTVGYISTHAAGRQASPLNHIIARVPQGVTRAELEARIFAAATVSKDGILERPIELVHVERLSRALGAASRQLFMAFLAAAGLLVAIAAINVSSLMAARSVDRGQELAVRRALGATPFEIARLLLVESGFLVGTSACIGLVLAAPLLGFTVELLPPDLALFKSAAIDWRIASFGVAIAAGLASVVALWPLRMASGSETNPGFARSIAMERRTLSRKLVLTVQVALALVLTVAGSLVVGSLFSVYDQTQHITTRNILTLSIQFQGLPSASGVSPERTARVNRLIERVQGLTGSDAVALTAYELLDRAYVGSWFRAPASALNPRQAVTMQAVTPEFYSIVQPQLVTGRLPSAAELASIAPVIIVSERVAGNYWPHGSAIGETLMLRGEIATTFTVVGVVKDVRWGAWDEEARPMIYGPYPLLARQSPSYLLIRTRGNSFQMAAEVPRIIDEVDPWISIGRVAPLDALFVDSVRPRRFRAWLFGSFSFASLGVMGIGIFGQLAMSTARRTREVGIRLACGATRAGIARLILSEQLLPVVVGLVTGGVIAIWSIRFVRSYLYQVTATDPRAWAAAIGLILFTAAAGTIIPAVRTSRIDPVQSLKAE